MSQPQGALLVGCVNHPDAETTIRTVAEVLDGRIKRIPDREVGERFHWILFQPDRLAGAEGIERVGDEPVMVKGIDARPVRVADGVDPASIELPPLGYADAALESYEVFRRLRDEGVVPGRRSSAHRGGATPCRAIRRRDRVRLVARSGRRDQMSRPARGTIRAWRSPTKQFCTSRR